MSRVYLTMNLFGETNLVYFFTYRHNPMPHINPRDAIKAERRLNSGGVQYKVAGLMRQAEYAIWNDAALRHQLVCNQTWDIPSDTQIRNARISMNK